MSLYNTEPSGFLYEQTGATPYGKWVIPASCIATYQRLPFEDDVFSCPRQADTYLRCVYGNYMQLPPEDQRENRHGIVKIKL